MVNTFVDKAEISENIKLMKKLPRIYRNGLTLFVLRRITKDPTRVSAFGLGIQESLFGRVSHSKLGKDLNAFQFGRKVIQAIIFVSIAKGYIKDEEEYGLYSLTPQGQRLLEGIQRNKAVFTGLLASRRAVGGSL